MSKAKAIEREYITKELAATQTGLSIRRLMEVSAAGAIRRKRARDPETGRNTSVFLASDVAKFSSVNAAYEKGLSVRGTVAPAPLRALPPPPEPEPAVPAYEWLSIAEAAHYTGLPESYLLQLVATEMLPARDVGIRPGGRWRVSKRRLDALAE